MIDDKALVAAIMAASPSGRLQRHRDALAQFREAGIDVAQYESAIELAEYHLERPRKLMSCLARADVIGTELSLLYSKEFHTGTVSLKNIDRTDKSNRRDWAILLARYLSKYSGTKEHKWRKLPQAHGDHLEIEHLVFYRDGKKLVCIENEREKVLTKRTFFDTYLKKKTDLRA